MNTWLEKVGELTSAHRKKRADVFAKLARRRIWKRRFEGYSDLYAKTDASWYRDRERGQRERPERVAACGSETLLISCVGCGTMHEIRSGCRVGLLCYPCRSVAAAAKRRIFRRARSAVVAEAARRGLFQNRRGGRWGEKFLTLTAPHLPTQSVTERIVIVLAAWARFLRRLNEFWKERGVRSKHWFRVFEWTPGSDDRGHPHLHVWILSPFLPRDELERWWREALAEQIKGPMVERVIIDIREVHGESAERELIKYLTKDITANGEKVAPEIYAEVYIALDGHRSSQASKGFMGKAKSEKQRCDCGCPLPKRVRKQPKKKSSAEPEQKP
jgi:hypothetical protein